jgi:hypothetical protein
LRPSICPELPFTANGTIPSSLKNHDHFICGNPLSIVNFVGGPNRPVLNTRVQRAQPAPQGLTLGPVTFLWHDEVLKVKTPTGTEYLTGTQAAELLGYLYNQREVILNKHK